MARLLLNGRYQYFVRPGFWALLSWALIILVAFTAALFFRVGSDTDQRAGYGPVIWIRTAVLLLPIFCLFVIQNDTLGSNAFKNRSSSTVLPKALFQIGKDKVPPKDGKLTPFQVLQYFKDFVGKPIVTEGQVYRDETVPEHHFLVYRFVVFCCVADALPAGELVFDGNAESFKQDSWVRVEGILGLKIVNGLYFPTIKADKITPIDPPDMPYLLQTFR